MVKIRLIVSGPPEDVQLIADVLETALPELFRWNNSAVSGLNNLISVEGVSVPQIVADSLVA